MTRRGAADSVMIHAPCSTTIERDGEVMLASSYSGVCEDRRCAISIARSRAFQHEPSAQSPWQNTMLGLVSVDFDFISSSFLIFNYITLIKPRVRVRLIP